MDQDRRLGLLDVFCIAAGAMVSSGLFVLPGIAHAHAGPAVIFSYLFAGLLAASGMLSVAEIITAMPKAGGDYYFITRTMGPAVGTVAGLLTWFSLTLKSAFALVGMSTFLAVVGQWDPRLTATAICAVFVAVNLFGAKETSRLQVFLVLALLGLMIFYVVTGLPNINSGNFLPFAPFGWHPVFATAGLVFVSYGGLLKVAAVAGEIENPGKVIPTAMILCLFIMVLLYTLMVFVTTGVLQSSVLDHSKMPISLGAASFMGRSGMVALSVAAIFAFMSTANAGIMAASRYLLSLGTDNMIPSVFGLVNRRFQTPHVAVLTTGLFLVGALFFDLETLVKAASTVVILTYILANLCLIVLRESRLLHYRPSFRAPLYPFLPLAGMIGYAFLVVEMGLEALAISALLVLGALFFYWFYGRIRTEREYALLHLVERVSNRKLTHGVLESELKEVIRSRDELCFDRFDEIVERATVIDIAEELGREELFSLIEGHLKDFSPVDYDTVDDALRAREREGSTAIVPGIAVSDIVVEGTGIFEMVLIRCRQGVQLGTGEAKIRVFFLLLTSRDERDFYLKTIASIAQIIHSDDFEKRWISAADRRQLRDLMHLSDRQRICKI